MWASKVLRYSFLGYFALFAIYRNIESVGAASGSAVDVVDAAARPVISRNIDPDNASSAAFLYFNDVIYRNSGYGGGIDFITAPPIEREVDQFNGGSSPSASLRNHKHSNQFATTFLKDGGHGVGGGATGNINIVRSSANVSLMLFQVEESDITVATSVSNNGDVVGFYTIPDPNPPPDHPNNMLSRGFIKRSFGADPYLKLGVGPTYNHIMPLDISRDGSAIVGVGCIEPVCDPLSSNYAIRGIRMTNAGESFNVIDLPLLAGQTSGGRSEAVSVSGDGSVIVGSAKLTSVNSHWKSFRWLSDPTGNRSLPGASAQIPTPTGSAPGGGNYGLAHQAYAVSDGGDFVGGYISVTISGLVGANLPYRWKTTESHLAQTQIPDLSSYNLQPNEQASACPYPSNPFGRILAVSADGQVLTGQSGCNNLNPPPSPPPTPTHKEIIRWTSEQGMSGGGDLYYGSHGLQEGVALSRARDSSLDGSVVVGMGTWGDDSSSYNEAVIWKAAEPGARVAKIKDLLLSPPFNLDISAGLPAGATLRLVEANAVSPDGTVVVGRAHYYEPGFPLYKTLAFVLKFGINELSPFAGGTKSRAASINNAGQIFGSANTNSSDTTKRAAYWRINTNPWLYGVTPQLPILPAQGHPGSANGSEFVAANEFGHLVGNINLNSPSSIKGFLNVSLDTIAPINGPLPVIYDAALTPIFSAATRAVGINSFGRVALFQETGATQGVLYWHDGSAHRYNHLPTYSNWRVKPAGINSLGEVVFNRVTTTGANGGAYVYNDDNHNGVSTGGPQEVRMMPGYGNNIGVVNATNNLGMYAGHTNSSYKLPTVWEDLNDDGMFISSEVQILPTATGICYPGGSALNCPAENVQVKAINNLGQAVGTWTQGQATKAVIWNGIQRFDLESLIPFDDTWTLKEALSINDEGMVVGYGVQGGNERAFVLDASKFLSRNLYDLNGNNHLDVDRNGSADLDDEAKFSQCLAFHPSCTALDRKIADYNQSGTVTGGPSGDWEFFRARFFRDGAAWKRGDIDGDNYLSATDLSLFYQYCNSGSWKPINKNTPSNVNCFAADVNFDRMVNAYDRKLFAQLVHSGSDGDIDDNGFIDHNDHRIFANECYGRGRGTIIIPQDATNCLRADIDNNDYVGIKDKLAMGPFPLKGDMDGNCMIDNDDLIALITYVSDPFYYKVGTGGSPSTIKNGDLNDDGFVSKADELLAEDYISSHTGQTCAAFEP